MLESALQPDGSDAGPAQDVQLAAGDATQPPRRGSPESFRALAARLSKGRMPAPAPQPAARQFVWPERMPDPPREAEPLPAPPVHAVNGASGPATTPAAPEFAPPVAEEAKWAAAALALDGNAFAVRSQPADADSFASAVSAPDSDEIESWERAEISADTDLSEPLPAEVSSEPLAEEAAESWVEPASEPVDQPVAALDWQVPEPAGIDEPRADVAQESELAQPVEAYDWSIPSPTESASEEPAEQTPGEPIEDAADPGMSEASTHDWSIQDESAPVPQAAHVEPEPQTVETHLAAPQDWSQPAESEIADEPSAWSAEPVEADPVQQSEAVAFAPETGSDWTEPAAPDIADGTQDWSSQAGSADPPLADQIPEPAAASNELEPSPDWQPEEFGSLPEETSTDPAIESVEPAPAPEIASEVEEPQQADETPERGDAIEMVEDLSPPQPAVVVDIAASLAAKFQGPVSILKRREVEDDPFGMAVAVPAPPPAAAPSVEVAEPDPQTGEVARSLLDIMSAPSSSTQPQERALAADTLLRLVPRIPPKTLVAVVERVCMMEAPPALLIARLIRDPRPEVAGPLLEKGGIISDQDLMSVVEENDEAKHRMIARRRIVSTALSDALIARGEPSVLLTLVRNPGASLSHDAFYRLCELAREHPGLQAPLATRADTPAPVAFELFWVLPAELRRLVLSRFLTDSENLNRILKIALSFGGDEVAGPAAAEVRTPSAEAVDRLVALLIAGRTAEAARLAESLGATCEANAFRIFADADGEPLTVLCKVIGLSRARFGDAIEQLHVSEAAALRQDRNVSELQSIFDSLSFNKARVLLTYWDWAVRKSGPYAALAA